MVVSSYLNSTAHQLGKSSTSSLATISTSLLLPIPIPILLNLSLTPFPHRWSHRSNPSLESLSIDYSPARVCVTATHQSPPLSDQPILFGVGVAVKAPPINLPVFVRAARILPFPPPVPPAIHLLHQVQIRNQSHLPGPRHCENIHPQHTVLDFYPTVCLDKHPLPGTYHNRYQL